jgi:hypothetical protein
MATNKRNLKAFVRFDGSGRVIPGSLILQRHKPKVGNWKEIQTYECCNYTPTTTTTTTPRFFPREYCVWSTNFLETSEYNLATNNIYNVSIDNDFTGVVGMTSTSTKLWKRDLATKYIREWFINSYPASLTYNREIRYSIFDNVILNNVIVAIDNNTIVSTRNISNETYPNGIPGAVSLVKYDISTSYAGYGTNVFSIIATHNASSIIYTTDNKFIIVASRLIDDVPTFYLTQYSYPDGLKEVDISLESISFNPSATELNINVITYNNEIYLIRNNDSSLFKIETTYPYNITEVTSDLGWEEIRVFHSSTGECNNVSFTPRLPQCGTTIPQQGETFTYFGVTGTVTTLSGGIANFSYLAQGYFAECSGLWQPPYSWIAISPAPSTIVLTFDSPINDVAIVLSILNLGDNFTITTNTEIPSITMSNSCYASVSGNQIISEPSISSNGGSGQFVITSITPYTVLTIQATSGGNGGPIGLSCDPNAPTTTSTTSSTTTLAPTGFNTIYTHFESL